MRQPFAETLIAGDTWRWTLRLSECGWNATAPAAASRLVYYFRALGKDGAVGAQLDLAAEIGPSGQFEFSALPEETSNFLGRTAWQLCLFDAENNRTEIARGTVEVLPDLATASGDCDPRSWAKRMLDAVRAVLENRATRVEAEYQIGGRHLRLLSPDELLKLEGDLEARYNRELIRSGQRRGSANQLRAAFGPRNAGPGVWR